MEGVLVVPKSGIRQRFVQRYVILDEARAALCWGKTREAAASPSAKKLLFADIARVDVTSTPGEIRAQAKKHVHLFRAETDAVAHRWVDAIRSQLPPPLPDKPGVAFRLSPAIGEASRLAAAASFLVVLIAALSWLTPSPARASDRIQPVFVPRPPRIDLIPIAKAQPASSSFPMFAALALTLALAALAVVFKDRVSKDLAAARRAIESKMLKRKSSRRSSSSRHSARRNSGRPSPILIPERSMDADKRADFAARLLLQTGGGGRAQSTAEPAPRKRLSLPKPLAARGEVALALGAALTRRAPPPQALAQEEQVSHKSERPAPRRSVSEPAVVVAANPAFQASEADEDDADKVEEPVASRRVTSGKSESAERRGIFGFLRGSPRSKSSSTSSRKSGRAVSSSSGGSSSKRASSKRHSSKRDAAPPAAVDVNARDDEAGAGGPGERLRTRGREYAKYARMMDSGLPEGAVRNAMARDGVKEPRGVFDDADDALYAAKPKLTQPAKRRSAERGSARQLPQTRKGGEALAAVGGSSGSIMDELKSRQERLGLRRGDP